MGYPSLSKASPVALIAPSVPKTVAAGFSFADGLHANAEYALTAIEGKARAGTPGAASGAWCMNHGLEMDEGFNGDFQAAAFRLDRKSQKRE